MTAGNCRFVPGACGKLTLNSLLLGSPVHAEQAALDVLGAGVPPDSDELCAVKTGNAGLILIARGRRIDRKFVCHRVPPLCGEPSAATT